MNATIAMLFLKQWQNSMFSQKSVVSFWSFATEPPRNHCREARPSDRHPCPPSLSDLPGHTPVRDECQQWADVGVPQCNHVNNCRNCVELKWHFFDISTERRQQSRETELSIILLTPRRRSYKHYQRLRRTLSHRADCTISCSLPGAIPISPSWNC